MMPDRATLVDAASKLGWRGEVIGPVSFGGVTFWAVCDESGTDASVGDDELQRRLSGCLFGGSSGEALVHDASLLAAYAPRAVVVDDDADVIGLLVDAAVLDQGVVAVGAQGVRVLSTAGPRVASGPVTPRGRRLLEAVEAARRSGRTLKIA